MVAAMLMLRFGDIRLGVLLINYKEKQLEQRTYWVCRNTECDVLGRYSEHEAAHFNYRCTGCLSRLETATVDTMTTCPVSLDRLAWPIAALSAAAAIAFNCYLRSFSFDPMMNKSYLLLSFVFLTGFLKAMYANQKRINRTAKLGEPAPEIERDDVSCQAFIVVYGIFFVVAILQPLWFLN